ncbi:MAG: GAF domain-containing protein [Chloroflexota bacterium]
MSHSGTSHHPRWSEISPEERERRYEFIVNTSKEFMALINRNYVYEAVNQAHAEAQNQSPEQIVGLTCSEVWGDDTFNNVIRPPLDQCFSGQEVNYQAPYNHGALGFRYMDVTYYPYYSADNVVSHAVVVSRDVTSREKAEQAMVRYAERLETLHEIDRSILEAQSDEDIANIALTHLRHLLPCNQARIIMFDSHTSLDKREVITIPEGVDGADSNQPLDQRLAEVVSHIEQGNLEALFHLENVQTLAQYPADTDLESIDSLAFLNMPLMSKGKLLGTLTLGTDDPVGFSQEHSEVAREVAYQVALVIQQAQLRKALQRYNDELEDLVAVRTQEIERRRRVAEGLRDIVTILNSSRSLQDILDYIFVQSQMLLGTDAVAVFNQIEESDDTIKDIASKPAVELQSSRSRLDDGLSRADVLYSQKIVEIALDERSVIPVADIMQPVVVNNKTWQNQAWVQQINAIGNGSTWRAQPSNAAFAKRLAQGNDGDEKANNLQFISLLVVPLIVHTTIYGSIVFYYTEAKTFRSEEIELATSLGDQVALAIENAKLHNRAEEAAIMEERERLARELHDSVTQSLYSLTLFAEAGRRRVVAGDVDAVEDYLIQLIETSQQALKEMRLLLYELRPQVLEQDGLVGVLRKRLDAVEKRAGVDTELKVKKTLHVPFDAEEGLYRIVQEALNNSLKHAEADKVIVHLYADGEDIVVDVTDDGGGFDYESVYGGMGLNNMNERAEKLGGTFSISSEVGVGTKVSVRLNGDKPVLKTQPN